MADEEKPPRRRCLSEESRIRRAARRRASRPRTTGSRRSRKINNNNNNSNNNNNHLLGRRWNPPAVASISTTSTTATATATTTTTVAAAATAENPRSRTGKSSIASTTTAAAAATAENPWSRTGKSSSIASPTTAAAAATAKNPRSRAGKSSSIASTTTAAAADAENPRSRTGKSSSIAYTTTAAAAATAENPQSRTGKSSSIATTTTAAAADATAENPQSRAGKSSSIASTTTTAAAAATAENPQSRAGKSSSIATTTTAAAADATAENPQSRAGKSSSIASTTTAAAAAATAENPQSRAGKSSSIATTTTTAADAENPRSRAGKSSSIATTTTAAAADENPRSRAGKSSSIATTSTTATDAENPQSRAGMSSSIATTTTAAANADAENPQSRAGKSSSIATTTSAAAAADAENPQSRAGKSSSIATTSTTATDAENPQSRAGKSSSIATTTTNAATATAENPQSRTGKSSSIATTTTNAAADAENPRSRAGKSSSIATTTTAAAAADAENPQSRAGKSSSIATTTTTAAAAAAGNHDDLPPGLPPGLVPKRSATTEEATSRKKARGNANDKKRQQTPQAPLTEPLRRSPRKRKKCTDTSGYTIEHTTPEDVTASCNYVATAAVNIPPAMSVNQEDLLRENEILPLSDDDLADNASDDSDSSFALSEADDGEQPLPPTPDPGTTPAKGKQLLDETPRGSVSCNTAAMSSPLHDKDRQGPVPMNHGTGVFSLTGTVLDWNVMLTHGRTCDRKCTRNVVMVFELPFDHNTELLDGTKKTPRPSDFEQRLLSHTCHMYIVAQDDFQIGWASSLSDMLHYQKDFQSLCAELDMFFGKYPKRRDEMGITCLGLNADHKDCHLVVRSFSQRETSLVDSLPWGMTKKQLSLLVSKKNGRLLKKKVKESNIGVPRQKVSKDLGYTSQLCQSRGACSLGLVCPNRLEHTKGKIGKEVFNEVTQFVDFVEVTYGKKIFRDDTRNQRFAGQLGLNNRVETTRAALYNGDETTWLLPHVDNCNGTDEGYGPVVWASQLCPPEMLFDVLCDSSPDVRESDGCYRLCQVMYSRKSIEIYMERMKEQQSSLAIFQHTYANKKLLNQRFFTPSSLKPSKITSIASVMTGWNYGVVRGNMQMECHLQPYIALMVKIVKAFGLDYTSAIAVAIVLSLDTNSVIPATISTHMLMRNKQELISVDGYNGIDVACYLLDCLKTVKDLGIKELFKDIVEQEESSDQNDSSWCSPGSRFGYESSFYRSVYLGYNTPMDTHKFRHLPWFDFVTRLRIVIAESKLKAEDKLKVLRGILSGWLGRLIHDNTRVLDHIMAMVSILGLIPIEMYLIGDTTTSEDTWVNHFKTRYPPGAEKNLQEWTKNAKATMRQWLHSEHKEFAQLYGGSDRYFEGVVQIVGPKILKHRNQPEDIVNLDAPNFIVCHNCLYMFYQDVGEYVTFGPNRGIFDVDLTLKDRQPGSPLFCVMDDPTIAKEWEKLVGKKPKQTWGTGDTNFDFPFAWLQPYIHRHSVLQHKQNASSSTN